MTFFTPRWRCTGRGSIDRIWRCSHTVEARQDTTKCIYCKLGLVGATLCPPPFFPDPRPGDPARNTPLDFVLLFSFNSFFLFYLFLPSLTCACTCDMCMCMCMCMRMCMCMCMCMCMYVHVVCRHTHHPRRNANAYTSTSQSGRHTPSSLRFLSSTHAKPAWSAAASIALQTQSEPRRSRGSTCVGNQAGSGLGPLALRRLPSPPEHASGGPKLRPASANQPLVPHWPAIQALLSTSCSTVSSRRASGLLGSSNAAAVVKRARRLAAVQGKSQMGE